MTFSATHAPARLRSLDIARGMIVLLMIIVNAAAYLCDHAGYPIYAALLHSRWAGFTLAHAVFPACVFLTGVSAGMSIESEESLKARRERLVVRTTRLLLLGLLVSNVTALLTQGPFRPMGVLQRLAIVSLAARLTLRFLSARSRLLAVALILLLYWPLCLSPLPDGGAANLAMRGDNIVSWFDRFLLGPYRYAPGPLGYDPEGLLSTFPAIAQALLGVTFGEWIARLRQGRGMSWRLALIGLVLVAIGLGWGHWYPIIKDIWTSTFVLVSSGVTVLLLAAAHAIFDRDVRPTPILSAFGQNAIIAYAWSALTSPCLGSAIAVTFYRVASALIPLKLAAMAPIVVYLGLVWAPLGYMQRRGWIVKL